MSAATTDSIEFEPIRWPEDPADYTIEDHWIVAAAEASDAVERYWNAMGERPSLARFEVMVADHLCDWKRDESGLPGIDDVPF